MRMGSLLAAILGVAAMGAAAAPQASARRTPNINDRRLLAPRPAGPFFLMMAALLAAVAFAAPACAAGKPNVVILLCDDLGYGDLGCFASPAIKTPNLDR